MTDTEAVTGHIFRPSLQNISLKRFRLRYYSYDDCYYLHLDDAVCPQLSKIKGLINGAVSSSGVSRQFDKASGQSYVTCEDNAESAHIEWQADFSSCGLVVMDAQVRVATSTEKSNHSGLEFTVKGDGVTIYPELGDTMQRLPKLTGCCMVAIRASFHRSFANNNSNSASPFSMLMGGQDNHTSPSLDFNIDLMCPRPKEDIYCGEILLGIKFGPDSNNSNGVTLSSSTPSSSPSPSSSSQDIPGCMQNGVAMECGARTGQLQVHVVEGARIVDEETKKPYKTVVKCNILPDSGRFGPKHTSPKHNAYPTWTENFIFNGVTKEDLLNGGLEVMLYDHHHFSGDRNIGGLRICVPRKKEDLPYHRTSPSPDTLSPALSRSTSPLPNISSPLSVGESTSPSPVSQSSLDLEHYNLSRNEKAKSLPSIHPSHSDSESSPLLRKRILSPAVVTSPNNLSPVIQRSQPDISNISPSSSPKSSPIALAKTFFRLSGSHLRQGLSPHSSPKSSPRLSRKKLQSFEAAERNSEFVHCWMEEVTPGESRHWRQVLEREGEWLYFWHSIRYKLKAAYS